VKSRQDREQKENAPRESAPRAARKPAAPSSSSGLLDMVLKAGESAAEFVRKTVDGVNPLNIMGSGQKIRECRKKINNLYIDIGNEAVNSWRDGLMETEKMAALLDELRKNEEKILSLQAPSAEVPQARKMQAARKAQAVKKEAVSTPKKDEEDSRVEEVISVAAPAEPVVPDVGEVDLPRPEDNRDAFSDIADIFVKK
jgi:hypothetical protein